MSASVSASASASTGTFTLLLFASASTFAGDQETLTLPAPTTLRGVFRTLESRFPGMTKQILRSSAVTVNLEYVDFDPDGLVEFELGRDVGRDENRESVGGEQAKGGDKSRGRGESESTSEGEGLDMLIREGDEVGIIPPVSSG
ncbi:hypothetical protein G647_08970 [Cladophialophora carrionii CBS 160.54]|uniref:Uncharacterized protein n=1 Tax=Cladophialophora carrionii CBS 160.54 TaxID=1279043 RepID=V9CZA3_9EURO|nr:uncharacterized protein G647_08970 [Cladophialophora carrionii CBS 160.54]ETI19955.1 hypothetical protein G647_08970 [Cladophialophora carrionii CBS 160.54]